MMKTVSLRLEQIMEINFGTELISNTNLPGKLSYKIGRLKNNVSNIQKVYEDSKNELIKKYGKEVEGQWKIEPDDPAMSKYVKEHNQILQEVDEIKVPEMKISEFKDPSTGEWLQLTSQFFACMCHVVSDDKEHKEIEDITITKVAEVDLGVSLNMTIPLPAPLAYKLGIIKYSAQQVTSELQLYRDEMIKKHGKFDQDKKQYLIEPTDEKANKQFRKSLESYTSRKVKLTMPELYLDEFVDVKGDELPLQPRFFSLLADHIIEERPKLKVNKRKQS